MKHLTYLFLAGLILLLVGCGTTESEIQTRTAVKVTNQVAGVVTTIAMPVVPTPTFAPSPTSEQTQIPKTTQASGLIESSICTMEGTPISD
jgi:hypothetical protein